MRILIVEDDRIIGSGLQSGLRQKDWAADWVGSKSQALSALKAEHFDLIILDIGLPDGSGLELLKLLRAEGSSQAVLILTARDAIEDRIQGLDLGADDYLTKPFDLQELAARVRAITRRHQGRGSNAVIVGDLHLDPEGHTLSRNGESIALSRREFGILQALMESSGKVLTHEMLEQKLYGWGDELDSNAIQVHVHHLRKKLGPDLIRTIRGVGYTLDASTQ